jgi:signal transduction histidine kinase
VKPLSIRLQLSLMMSLLTLVIITVLSVAAYIEFEESLLGNIDATLRAIGEGLRAELEDEEPQENRLAELRAFTGYGSREYASQCRIWTDANEVDLFSSDPPETPADQRFFRPPSSEPPAVGDFRLFDIARDARPGTRRPLRALWIRYPLREQIVNIVVARSSYHVYHELGEFLRLLLVTGGGITLIALLLVPRIVAWGLRPITRARGQLEQITHRSLGQENRIMGDAPVELRPFRTALDGMLVRLDKAMRQQERLTADAAHELRTPLAIMKSTLQTMRMQPRKVTEYEEGVDETLQDIERMEQLVGQLLTLARLDAGDEVPDPVEVRLDALLESLADVFNCRARRQGARVICANVAAVRVLGNETELRQLFSNLLDNALRYGPPTGVVRITLQDGPGPWVTACVHDEGGDIPPDKLPYLFDRFYRVDPSRSHAYGGSGLGLAIARQTVQRHHGTIAITSDPQAGTVVAIQLPRSPNA